MRYCFFTAMIVLLVSSACKEETNREFSDQFSALDSIVKKMESQLSPLEKEINTLAHYTEGLFENKDYYLQNADKSRYKQSVTGVVYREEPGPSESSVYVSSKTKDLRGAYEQLYFTEAMDSLMEDIYQETPFVSQVYFNTKLQVCRIFPAYDILNIADANLDLTSFNFYYLADEVRNPDRETQWVDEVYIDPAGRGWILSLIHPVYYQEELQGVVGLDITVNDLLQHFLDYADKKLLIVDVSGTVVAGTSEAIEVLMLPPLKNHTYVQTINSDSYRKEDFNLFKSKSKEVRKMISKFLLEKENYYELESQYEPHRIYCRQMNLLNWYVLQID